MGKHGSRIAARTIAPLLLGVGAILLLAVFSFAQSSPAINETGLNVAYAAIPIPIPVQSGKEVFEVGPLPASLKSVNPKLAKWKLGYMCEHMGILWADLWSWDCKLVAYDEPSKTYTDLPEPIRLQLEAKYPMSKADRGFWNHYGIVVLIVIVMVLGALKKPQAG